MKTYYFFYEIIIFTRHNTDAMQQLQKRAQQKVEL